LEKLSHNPLFDKIFGCLLGGVIGDAMGRPAENKSYQEIQETFGQITDFSGSGTDDSALKHILCDTIIKTGGYPTADAWAEEWLEQEELFLTRRLFWIPVMNAFWKLRGEGIAPREVGNGNMASSSSAMCISPLGIINPGNPRQAVLEAYEVASLIHHNFCRDAACSMAAAVAAAFAPDASVASVLDAAVAYLPPRSTRLMREAIAATLALAGETHDYESFRKRFYDERLLPGIAIADSRETVPVALALFYLAGGDPRQTIIFAANFGRDADTIASMAGAISGAFKGVSAFPPAWIEQATRENPRSQEKLAQELLDIVINRTKATHNQVSLIHHLHQPDHKS
jgi:ADP-ribosylglycohydrolase